MMHFIANLSVVAVFLLVMPMILLARLLSPARRSLVFYYGLMVLFSTSFAVHSALTPKGIRVAFMRAVCSDAKTLAGALEMYSIDNPDDKTSSFLHIDNISNINDSTLDVVRKAGYLQSVPGGRRMEVVRSYRGWQVEASVILDALNSWNREHGLSQYSINSVKTIDRKSLIILKQQGYIKAVPSPYIMYMLTNHYPDYLQISGHPIKIKSLEGIEGDRSRSAIGDWWMR